LLVAPSTTIFIPSYVWISVIGLIGLGFSFSVASCNYILTLQKICEERLHKGKDKDSINVTINGLYISNWLIADLLGPMAGGYLTEIFGFGDGNIIWCGISMIILILFLTFGKGYIHVKNQFIKSEIDYNELNECE